MKKRGITARISAFLMALILTVCALPLSNVQAQEIGSDETMEEAGPEDGNSEENESEEVGSEDESQDISDSEQDDSKESGLEESNSEEMSSEETGSEEAGSKEDASEFVFVPNNRIVEPKLSSIDLANTNLPAYYINSDIVKGAETQEKYDSRDYDYITGIRNQNPFGTCWAFATIGAVEANVIKKGYATKALDLSEQAAAYFTYHSQNDPLGLTPGEGVKPNYSSDNEGKYMDFGGSSYYAGLMLMNWEGPIEEALAPYQTKDASWAVDSSLAYGYDKVHLQGIYMSPMSSIDAVKKLIADYGAVASAYYHDDSYLNGYAYYTDEDLYGTNHAITIIGWDDNYDKSNFKSDNGVSPEQNGAWIVKNSWGTWFANSGYFYISYYDYNCKSYANAIAFDVDTNNNYDYNYHYDGGVPNYSLSYPVAKDIATVFTAQNPEKVEAVSVYFGDTNTNYKVAVYKNSPTPDGSAPSSIGEPVYSTEGTAAYAGYYTFRIPDEKQFHVDEGDSYAVVVSLPADYYTYYACSADSTYYIYEDNCANAGYFKSSAGTTWSKFTYGDFPMKAYTSLDEVSDEPQTIHFEISLNSSPAKNFTEKAVDQITFKAVEGVDSYQVFYREGEDYAYSEVGDLITEKKENYCIENIVPFDMKEQLPLQYMVEGYDAEGNLIAVSQVESGISDLSFEFTANVFDDAEGLKLGWNAVAGASFYEVSYWNEEDSTWVIADNIYQDEETAFTYLIDKEDYDKKFCIVAYDEESNGQSSNELILDKFIKTFQFTKESYEVNSGETVTLEFSQNPAGLNLMLVVRAMNAKTDEEYFVEEADGILQIKQGNKSVLGTLDRSNFKFKADVGCGDTSIAIIVKYGTAEASTVVNVHFEEKIAKIGFGKYFNPSKGMGVIFVKNKVISVPLFAIDNVGNSVDIKEDTNTFLFTSSDPSIVAVNSSGNELKMTLKATGYIRITATLIDNPDCVASIPVRVVEDNISKSPIILTINKKSDCNADFRFEFTHDIVIPCDAEIMSVKKGSTSYPKDLFKVTPDDEIWNVITLPNPDLVSTGCYKIKMSVKTYALKDNRNSDYCFIDSDKTIEYEKEITVYVIDSEPEVGFGKASVNVFDSDTYSNALVFTGMSYSYFEENIEDISVVSENVTKDNLIFAQHFTVNKENLSLEFKEQSDAGVHYRDYKKSSIKGKIRIKLKGYKEPIVREITVKTPYTKESIKQGAMPVIQFSENEKNASILLFNSKTKALLDNYTITVDEYDGKTNIVSGMNGYQIKLIADSYKNNEVISIPVKVKRENWLEPVSVTIKAKVVTQKPKIVMKKTSAKVNIDPKAVVNSEIGLVGPSVSLPMSVDQANVRIKEAKDWRIEKLNPATKKYESVAVSVKENGAIETGGLVITYDSFLREVSFFAAFTGSEANPVAIAAPGIYKYRLYVLDNYTSIYKDVTITVTDKEIIPTVKASGKLNLVSRAFSEVLIQYSLKNTDVPVESFGILAEEVPGMDGVKYTNLFNVGYNSSKKKYTISPATNVTIKPGTYYIPVILELTNNVEIRTTVKVVTEVKIPGGIKSVSLQLKKTSNFSMFWISSMIPKSYLYTIKSVEVIDPKNNFELTDSDGFPFYVGIQAKDSTIKKGKYTVTIKMYLEGDDYNTKPITKNITINVKE